jgi:intracellular multiplication protein IcmG
MDNLMKDDEYHFSEGGNTNQSYETAAPRSGGAGGSKRKNIFLVIGVLIIVVMVFKILGHLHGNKTATAVAPVVTPSVKPMPTLKAAIPQPDLQVQSRLNSVENKVNEISGAMTGINQQLQSINTQLQSLSAAVTQQQMDINALRAVKKKVTAVKVVTTPLPTKAYTIQAMVPGRAWLNASDGSTLTVQSGDQLPGYGTVLDIVPSQAMIATSSGRVLAYSSDDS